MIRRALVLLPLAAAAGWAWSRGRRPTAPDAEPAPLPGSPRLVSVLGGSVPYGEATGGSVTDLRGGRQVLGRARDADLHLADPTVSPRHALIEADREGRVVIRDLGALNGLSVDGIPTAAAELHDGNRVQLGDVQLVYRADPVADGGGRSGGELGEQIGR